MIVFVVVSFFPQKTFICIGVGKMEGKGQARWRKGESTAAWSHSCQLSALRVEDCNCNCVDNLICVVYTGGGCFSCHFERNCVGDRQSRHWWKCHT